MSNEKHTPDRDNQQARDNARRIVACVNACDGIDTEALDSSALLDLIKAGHSSARLAKQRDELLAALERAEHVMSNVAALGIPEALEMARVAIANAKGGA